MSEQQIKVLLDLGYNLDYRNTYLFKSIYGEKHHEYTSIFIDIKTSEVSIEGVDKFKGKLLKEIEGVLR